MSFRGGTHGFHPELMRREDPLCTRTARDGRHRFSMQMSKLDHPPMSEPSVLQDVQKANCKLHGQKAQRRFLQLWHYSPVLSSAHPPSASPATLSPEGQGRSGELLHSAVWWGWWAGKGSKGVATLICQLHEKRLFLACMAWITSGDFTFIDKAVILLQMRIRTNPGSLYCPNESAYVKRTQALVWLAGATSE